MFKLLNKLNIFKKKSNNRYIEDINFSICNVCANNDEFCFSCNSCIPSYSRYPSNFISIYVPKIDKIDIGVTSEYNDKLKSCPFCGGISELVHVEFDDGDTWYRPQCSICNSHSGMNYETVNEAIKMWNKRI